MLKYYNDGKERSQSHEIYDSELNGIVDTGYGSTLFDAVDEYKANVNNHLKKVEMIYKRILDNPEIHIVNCLGWESND